MGGDLDETGDELISFFGVGTDGKLAFPAERIADIAELATSVPTTTAKPRGGFESTLGLPSRLDPEDLAQAGWGVVFADGVTDDVKHALAPLLARRKEQAGALYQELGCGAADSLKDLQQRWQFSPGVVEPEVVPGYLLLVGDPEQASFELQHALDVDFAVGRLDLASVADVEAYVAAVLRAEDRPSRRRATGLFATRNPDDGATRQSCDNLVSGLRDQLAAGKPGARFPAEPALAEQATKPALLRLLASGDAPALMLAACHGAVARAGAADQRELHGALVTQEWPGPLGAATRLDEAWRVAAGDVGEVDLGGLIAMLFACFGGGVPAKSQYPYYLAEGVRELAPVSFTSRLPQRLLARGAGAVIAHVERTWDVGFRWRGVEVAQLATIRSMLEGLMLGRRVGNAMADFNARYSSVATQFLSFLLANLTQGQDFPRRERAQLWMATYDARGWMVLGDPAVRLAAAPADE